jgi:hypothetical protein
MTHFFSYLRRLLLLPGLAGAGLATAQAQDLTNAGTTVAVQPGTSLYVGPGGLTNQAGGTLTNGGTLRVDGPLANAGTLDLSTGTLEVRGDLANTGTLAPGTSLVTFSGAADQLLTAGGATLYQLFVNKPTAGANTLRLADDLKVGNLLSLTNGLVSTRNGATLSTLRLPNGATLSGEGPGRYVLGRLEILRNGVSGAAVDFGHGAVLNPTSNNLGTVAITRTAGLLTDNVSRGVNFANAGYKGIDRIWTVEPATQPSAAVQLTLSWLPDNDNGLTSFAQARMWQQAAAGQPWAAVGPAACAVRVAWATATEHDNAGFTVERSRDARTFAAIGTVAGAGTSAVRHDYGLLDQKLPAEAALLYYRLRQTDGSGEFSYSPVRTVALAPEAAGFVVYPTRVASGQAATYLYTGPAGPGTLDILNVIGQVLGTVALDGRATGPVPLAGLATGAYFLRYTGPAGRFVTRCVVE